MEFIHHQARLSRVGVRTFVTSSIDLDVVTKALHASSMHYKTFLLGLPLSIL